MEGWPTNQNFIISLRTREWTKSYDTISWPGFFYYSKILDVVGLKKIKVRANVG